MKTLTILKTMLLLIIMSTQLPLWAQHVAGVGSFEGIWAGKVTDDNDNGQYVIIRISNNQVSKYSYNEDRDAFEISQFDKQVTMQNGNNMNFTWMNKGGVWSETQTHLLSYLRPERLWCRLIRQVTNAQEDEDVKGMNNEWAAYYTGMLKRYDSIDAYLSTFK